MKKLIFILLSFIHVSYSYHLQVVNHFGELITLEVLYKESSGNIRSKTGEVYHTTNFCIDLENIQEIKLIQSSGFANDYIWIKLPDSYSNQLLLISLKHGTISDKTYKWVTIEEYKKLKQRK